VIAETERLLERTLGEHVELRTTVEPGLGQVRADRAQLEQVLVNLSINARDAMPDGGVLTIDARNAGDCVRLTVSDTGAGMAQEVLDRAFEPFFSTKPAGEGTGLGLATVYGIVRGADGSIELRSDEGSGTTVIVQLPATRDAPVAAEHVQEPDRQPGRGEQVLLVEDKEAVRVLSERILTDGGYEVVSAPDAAAALALHGEHGAGIEALITDVVMPGLSGQDLADELRRRRPGLPVVFVSGYADDHVVEDARRDGATAFVEKPFTADELLAALRGVLDER
jgi:two-component system cell cycle sensor histidine kinase/response regulator CckA